MQFSVWSMQVIASSMQVFESQVNESLYSMSVSLIHACERLMHYSLAHVFGTNMSPILIAYS